jgi:hypothetical protein
MEDNKVSDTPEARPEEAPTERVRYGLTRAVLGGAGDFIEISREEFIQLQRARANIFAALSIEELLDNTVENFLELEGDMLTTGLRRGVTLDWRWNSFVEDRQRVNRRLGNLLSSARQLIDSTPLQLEKIFGPDSAAATELKKAQSYAYDGSFAYRLMEALRNHTQHQGMPVGEISVPHSRETVKGVVRWGCTLKAKILISELAENERFKKTIANELASRGEEELDLFPLVREYLGGIGAAFRKLRECMNVDVKRWESMLRAAVRRGRETFSVGVIGLAAVEHDLVSLEYTQTCWLDEDPLQRLELLATKNRILHVVASKYVASSE